MLNSEFLTDVDQQLKTDAWFVLMHRRKSQRLSHNLREWLLTGTRCRVSTFRSISMCVSLDPLLSVSFSLLSLPISETYSFT